jgi:exonuclease III
VWFGERTTRGIGVFSYTGLQFSLYEGYDPTIRYCVPLKVSGFADLHLLAVWAMGHSDRKLRYAGQLAQAITRYRHFLSEKETIIAGDFNSNKQWDRKPGVGNHSWVVAMLEELGLASVYHHYTGEAQGEESQKTLYMYRRQDKVYHIDYCFVPRSWMNRLQSFSVGQYGQWRMLSDHMPLLVEFADG